MSEKTSFNQETGELIQAENRRLRLENERLWKQSESIADANAHAAELMIELEESNENLKKEIQKRRQVEEELSAYKCQLEEKIIERTQELKSTNVQLRKEIVEHRQTEEKLKYSVQKAEEANEYKTQFLAKMSHEIRTPMNAIIGFSDLLMEEPLTESQLHFVKTISRGARNLLTIINDILDFSKIEAGKFVVNKVDCNPTEIIQNVHALLAKTANNKGLEFQTCIAQSVPKTIMTDPTRLRQCLINLVNNAIKFTEQGNVTIGLSVFPSKGRQPMLQISVKDTGIGIDPDQLENVFSAFCQADNSTTRQYGGTGLGLAITKQLIELLHGSIAISSEPGKGTEFVLHLPLDEAKNACK